MKKFLFKTSFAFLIFWLPFLLIYIVEDPFKVIYKYNNYSNAIVFLNRDFVSTQTFLNNYPKHKYNSFIFGSSRSMGFNPSSWKQYLNETSVPFSFDASYENIKSIRNKIKYLDKKGVKIQNAIILICRDVTFNDFNNTDEYIVRKHPATSGQSKFLYQYNSFESFVNQKFVYNYFEFKFTQKYKPYMEGYIETRQMNFDSITNFMSISPRENNKYKTSFNNTKEFYDRPIERIDSVSRIKSIHVKYLKEIKNILDKHKAKYIVILTPLYEQIKFNTRDTELLTSLFGRNLHDFSGKNRFTDNKNNYFESSHFRPVVGDSIFQIIASNKK